MAMTLLIAYLFVFILQLFLLVQSIRKQQKTRWIALFAAELLSALAAAGLCWYFESLPGGMFGGLTYLGEVLFSFGAAAVYGMMLLISAFCYLVTSGREE